MAEKLCKCGKPRKVFSTGRVDAYCADCRKVVDAGCRQRKKLGITEPPKQETNIIEYLKSIVTNRFVVTKMEK